MWSFLASEDDVFLFFYFYFFFIFYYLFSFSLLTFFLLIAGTWDIATYEMGYLMNKQDIEEIKL